MSSYLTFYIGKKNEGGENDSTFNPIPFLSFSRSSYIYQAFDECGVRCKYETIDEDKIQYTEVTHDLLQKVRDEVSQDIKQIETKVELIKNNLSEKASERMDMLIEVEEWMKYVEDLQWVLNYTYFLADVLSEFRFGVSADKCLLCNIEN